jgi:hypothetical protein
MRDGVLKVVIGLTMICVLGLPFLSAGLFGDSALRGGIFVCVILLAYGMIDLGMRIRK